MRDNGAHERNRTVDLLLTMEMLYRLSYVGGVATRGIKPKRDRGLVSLKIASPVSANEIIQTQKNPFGLPLPMQEGRRSLRTENGIRRRTCSQQEICGLFGSRASGGGSGSRSPFSRLVVFVWMPGEVEWGEIRAKTRLIRR